MVHDGAVELARALESVARRAPRCAEGPGGPPPQDLPAVCFTWLPHVARLGVAGLCAAATVVGLFVSLALFVPLDCLLAKPLIPTCFGLVTFSTQLDLVTSMPSIFLFTFFILRAFQLFLLDHIFSCSQTRDRQPIPARTTRQCGASQPRKASTSRK